MAEQRGRGDFEMTLASGSAPIVFALTSIVWREAWKYDERAYRYCLHDIGHAWQALALCARAIGCDSFAAGHFPDDEVAKLCRLNRDEWPMLIVSLHGKSIPVREADTGKTVWFGGQATQLSKETIAHPLIDSIHFATKPSSRRSGGTSTQSRLQPAPVRSSFCLRLHRLAAWRSCSDATLGARLPWWKAIDLIGEALGQPRRHSPAIVG
jgi:nitroreductase